MVASRPPAATAGNSNRNTLAAGQGPGEAESGNGGAWRRRGSLNKRAGTPLDDTAGLGKGSALQGPSQHSYSVRSKGEVGGFPLFFSQLQTSDLFCAKRASPPRSLSFPPSALFCSEMGLGRRRSSLRLVLAFAEVWNEAVGERERIGGRAERGRR